MTLSSILVFIALGALFRLGVRGKGRAWVLLVASALAVYWLQPASPVRNLDFWFPTLTLAVAVLGWVFTTPQGGAGATPPESHSWRANAPAVGVLVGVALLVGLTRLFPDTGIIIPSRPPVLEQVLAGLALLGLLVGLLARVRLPAKALWGVIALLLALLVVLKAPPLAQAVSAGLRGLMNQSTSLAAAGDLRWLGFSYIAFRLISTLRERQGGRLPAVSLQEYLIYVIFFPSLTAGPIDRLDRFIKDLRGTPAKAPARAGRPQAVGPASSLSVSAPTDGQAGGVPNPTAPGVGPASSLSVSVPTDGQAGGVPNPTAPGVGHASSLSVSGPTPGETGGMPNAAGAAALALPSPFARFSLALGAAFTSQEAGLWAGAGQRLVLGLFKKFVIADSLALVALNASNAVQVQGAGWTWLLVYAYSFQIFFDFAGYTDIAIGLGRLVGISLPENFNAPYLKPNLTQFWSNWHMTLTNWFRAYYFNPVTRWLRTLKLPAWARHAKPQAAGEGEAEAAGLSPALIIFFTQLSTMILIGLWHGVTWNFVLWGAWHGLGQFIQNRFSEWMRPRHVALAQRPRLQKAYTVLSTLLTFHFVALGWVFFALPEVGLATGVFGKLFGM